MQVTILKKNLFVLVILFITGCVTYNKYTAQQMTLLKLWPRNSPSGNIDGDPVYKGYIVTKNKDTLQGLIKFQSLYKPKEFMHRVLILPLNKTHKSDIISYQRNDINVIHVYQDPSAKNYVDYVKINDDEGFSTLLAKKDNVIIYTAYAHGGYKDSPYAGKVTMMKDSSKITVYNYSSYLFHTSQTLFVKFINKRYKQHFTKVI